MTGYEFLTDSSQAVQSQLQQGTGTTPDTLINDTWTADQLRAKLLPTRHDLVYLAGHFDATRGPRGRQQDDRHARPSSRRRAST